MELFKTIILLNFLSIISISTATFAKLRSNFRQLFFWKETPPLFLSENGYLGSEESQHEDLQKIFLLSDWESKLPKNGFFWGMSPGHMFVVSTITDIILSQPTASSAVDVAAELRDRPEVNPVAWLNAVARAAMLRNDWVGLSVPSIVEILPGNFIPGEIIEEIKQNAGVDSRIYRDEETCDVTVDGTIGEDNGDENILWYFREDVMLNAHHWYWHLANPIDAVKGTIDRKGELFYYFHHSALARFFTERITNGMDPVTFFEGSPGSIIELGYNPHLTEANSGLNWTIRPAERASVDICNGKLIGTPMYINLEDRWAKTQNVLEAIEKGEVVSADNPDEPISIQDSLGIDYLGSMIEATYDSVNPDLYYDYGIHNSGHNIISLVEDPDESLDLPPGVMGESSTAMRDTMFYRHHTFVDDIFSKHKAKLEPYKLNDGEWPLVLPGVSVDYLKVQISEGEHPENELRTFFETRQYDLSRGLDFNKTDIEGPLYVCHLHLNHLEFEYHLGITRAEDAEEFGGKANVRIYLGPSQDKDGNPHTLEQIRNLMFVLDVFTADLEPGVNNITRNSKDTPLTIDFPQRLGEVEDPVDPIDTPYCGCGWPHHMLLPRSTVDGFPFELFAIVTNAEDDFVEELPEPRPDCKEAYIFCGVIGAKYPDKRPMGWPFDRILNLDEGDGGGEGRQDDQTIEVFAEKVPNAAHATVTIFHDAPE